MELDYKAIGKRIKIARIKADMTQERLSSTIDIAPSHMSNIETGTTRVSLTTLVKIANTLNVTVDDLLCENLLNATVPLQNDISDLVQDCSPSELEIIKGLIQSTLQVLRRQNRLRNNE